MASAKSVPSGLAGAASGRVGRSLEGVEDQVEANLELVAVVVAGLEYVPHSQLGEVGVLTSRHLTGVSGCCRR